MSASAVVVGGGYGGVAAAKALDGELDVTLIEPRESFFHAIAALRALVDPEWLPRILIPYDNLLRRGRIVRERVAALDGTGVLLDSSRRLDADYVVVASGAKYRYPAKADTDGDEDTMVRYRETHAALQRARSVLLLGAGAVGVELAGEITSTWPNTRVTIVDPLLELLGGRYDAALCAELRRQLEARGVRLLLGRTVSLPSTPPGELLPFAALTDDGEEVRADMWFPCFGISPDADYLGANGWLDVTPELRLRGSANVFAIGDVTGAAEWKNASTAQLQAEVAAHNILAHARGGDTRVYEPVRPNITIPLGSTGGAALRAGGVVLGAEETVEAKSRVMHVPHYTEVLGAQPSSPRSAAS